MKILAAAIDGLPEQVSVLLQLGVVREDLGGLLQLNQGGHQAAHLGWKGRLNGKVSPILWEVLPSGAQMLFALL